MIDDCDYYIVISAGRYGSIGPDGIGYTEMEYRYAAETGKPIIAFLHKDPGILPKKDTENDENGQDLLAQFRELMKKRMCKFWDTPQNLGSVVSRSLIMLQRKHPGIGWVRGDLVPDTDSTEEILKLRKKIETLNSQLQTIRTLPPPGTDKLKQGEDQFEIDFSCTFKDYHYDRRRCRFGALTTWDDIFYTISPLMIQECEESKLRESLEEFAVTVAAESIREVIKDEETLENANISNDDFQTIKVQLLALGLIEQSVRNRSVKDKNIYWTLTAYGDSSMHRLRALARDDG